MNAASNIFHPRRRTVQGHTRVEVDRLSPGCRETMIDACFAFRPCRASVFSAETSGNPADTAIASSETIAATSPRDIPPPNIGSDISESSTRFDAPRDPG